MFDIAIVGGGVCGTLIARELARFDLSIILLEKENDVGNGTTKANSGIVHAGYDPLPNSLKARLNVRGADLMKNVARELSVPYRNNGSMVLAFDREDLDQASLLLERGHSNGVTNLELIDAERLRELEPHISPEAIGALYVPDGSLVCPYQLAIAAMGNAMANGVELKRNFAVRAIEDDGHHFLIHSPRETVEAVYLVNAAGLFGDEIAAMVGDHYAITPVRGEYLLLDREYGNYVRHTLFQMPTARGKGVLVTPTVDYNLLIGPSAEAIDDKSDLSVTSQGLENIIALARRSVPNLPLPGVITSFAGLRARGTSGDFTIEAGKNAPRCLHVIGIESPGLVSSPAIAEYAVKRFRDMGLKLQANPDFDPIYKNIPRLREMSVEQRTEMIRYNPAYGRIVCRCEEISEGEILDAIRTAPGALDCDGVKRRVRAGMGRCQGGFCQPLVAELLSRELNIELSQVTKCGEGSALLTGKVKENHE